MFSLPEGCAATEAGPGTCCLPTFRSPAPVDGIGQGLCSIPWSRPSSQGLCRPRSCFWRIALRSLSSAPPDSAVKQRPPGRGPWVTCCHSILNSGGPCCAAPTPQPPWTPSGAASRRLWRAAGAPRAPARTRAAGGPCWRRCSTWRLLAPHPGARTCGCRRHCERYSRAQQHPT